MHAPLRVQARHLSKLLLLLQFTDQKTNGGPETYPKSQHEFVAELINSFKTELAFQGATVRC